MQSLLSACLNPRSCRPGASTYLSELDGPQESVEIAKALLAKGASTDIKNLDGQHALDVALHHAHVAGSYEVHGVLAEHAEKKRQDLEKHHAAQYEEWKKGTPDPSDKTDARAALHARAAMSGHVNVADELMKDSPMY